MKVFITGATSGIGQQLALDYVAQGAEVWGLGRDESRLAVLAEQGITTISAELTDKPQVLQALAQLPEFDLIILAAGGCEYLNPQHFDADLCQRVWATNLYTVALCIEALWPKLKSGSQLAIVGSMARLLPFTQAGAYGASKAALYYLANSLRTDLKPQKVSVHYIQPGFVDTPLTRQNHFSMPTLISVQQASVAIRSGLSKGKLTISFPKRLSSILHLLNCLPLALQTTLCAKLAAKEKR